MISKKLLWELLFDLISFLCEDEMNSVQMTRKVLEVRH